MVDPRLYHFTLPQFEGAVLPEPPSAWYPRVQEHYPHCTSDRALHGDSHVRTFVIHATDGSSAAGAMSVMFSHAASWHWLIPGENDPEHGRSVWACAPEQRAAWHVRNDRFHPDVNRGSRYINYSSLGLEIVNRQRNDPFSDWQLHQAAALVRYAWSKYSTLVDVVSHAKLDPMRRSDPGTEFDWDKFRALVTTPATLPESRIVIAAGLPISVIGPKGEAIECEARSVDGVMMVEAKALIEGLGFSAQFESGVESGGEFRESSATRIIINSTVARGPSRVKPARRSLGASRRRPNGSGTRRR